MNPWRTLDNRERVPHGALLVAGHDALPTHKQMADVRCWGKNDDVVINNVLAQAPEGAMIYFRGTFHLDKSLRVKSYMRIDGGTFVGSNPNEACMTVPADTINVAINGVTFKR